MSFFDAIGKLGKAAVGTALLPLDVARDIADPFSDGETATERRLRKIAENAEEAIEEIDE